MSFGKRDYFSRLQTSLVFLIFNGSVKNKIANRVFHELDEIGNNANIGTKGFTM